MNSTPRPTIGSLFSGYGGLDMAVESVTAARTAWVSDIDPGACKILAHTRPGIPNLGNIELVDWSAVEPVEILTAGYPCQPFSLSGDRKGTDDDRHLWPFVRDAIRHLRPRLTVLENVAGHRSMGFDRVLGDMAEDGLHARWTSIRASDVGAAHRRERIFITATDPSGVGHEWGGPARLGGHGPANGDSPSSDTKGIGRGVRDSEHVGSTPREGNPPFDTGDTPANPEGDARRKLDRDDSATADTSSIGPRKGRAEPEGIPRRPDAAECGVVDWQQYEPAIRRWERVTGRIAPRPIELTRRGAPKLSPHFDEWFMGLPEGWITDTPGLGWGEALKACGNGVVPQQAIAAIGILLGASEVAA